METQRLTAEGGCKLIADTSAYTGQGFYCFIVQEDTVIATLAGGTSSSATGTNFLTTIGLSGKTLKQGALIVAPTASTFNSITLTSGSIICYKHPANIL